MKTREQELEAALVEWSETIGRLTKKLTEIESACDAANQHCKVLQENNINNCTNWELQVTELIDALSTIRKIHMDYAGRNDVTFQMFRVADKALISYEAKNSELIAEMVGGGKFDPYKHAIYHDPQCNASEITHYQGEHYDCVYAKPSPQPATERCDEKPSPYPPIVKCSNCGAQNVDENSCHNCGGSLSNPPVAAECCTCGKMHSHNKMELFRQHDRSWRYSMRNGVFCVNTGNGWKPAK